MCIIIRIEWSIETAFSTKESKFLPPYKKGQWDSQKWKFIVTIPPAPPIAIVTLYIIRLLYAPLLVVPQWMLFHLQFLATATCSLILCVLWGLYLPEIVHIPCRPCMCYDLICTIDIHVYTLHFWLRYLSQKFTSVKDCCNWSKFIVNTMWNCAIFTLKLYHKFSFSNLLEYLPSI